MYLLSAPYPRYTNGIAALNPRITNIAALNGLNFGVLIAGVIHAMNVIKLAVQIKYIKKFLTLNSSEHAKLYMSGG